MKRTRLILLAFIIAGVVSAAAFSAIPGQDGTVSFCYATKANGGIVPGTARIVDENEPCRFYEHRINVSQRGPQGPTGPTGARGPTGPKGDKGDPGTSDFHWEPYCRSNSSPREIDPQACTAVQLKTGWFDVHIAQTKP